ncbi:hypothetical protein ACFQHQ_17665 [Zunongwangia atlantica 22II14-10F7]|uniref:Lipoprotein n=2 Tax=Zunongwangia TaxID=417127 RepID=A0A1Y1SZ57_9FLAO|nr:hypothetical protein IIF7_17707 [Zunongwangia atlantica 22II14-10F7]
MYIYKISRFALLACIIFFTIGCQDSIGVLNLDTEKEEEFYILIPPSGNFKFSQYYNTATSPAKVRTELSVISNRTDTISFEIMAFQKNVFNYHELAWVYSGTIISNTGQPILLDSISTTLLDAAKLKIAIFSKDSTDKITSGHIEGNVSLNRNQQDEVFPIYGNLDRDGNLFLMPSIQRSEFDYIQGFYSTSHRFSGFSTSKANDTILYANTDSTFYYSDSTQIITDTLHAEDDSQKLSLFLKISNP